MTRLTPPFIAVLALAVCLSAALAFESVYDVSIRHRPPEPLAAGSTLETRTRSPLELRMVDSGGVGIPLAQWGGDYRHDRRVFRDAILADPPYVDEAAFRRIEQQWRIYIERMIEYGNNAVVVPLLLEMIDFDRVPGAPVYIAGSSFRSRHEAVRRHFAPLLEWTASRGMQVFLEADMLSLTSPLEVYLRSLAPDTSRIGIRTASSAVWNVYGAGFEELFDTMPAVAGVVIRFGEGGSLYNTDGWPYRSEKAVRDVPSLQAMLQSFLPIFENHGKTLVLRSWTVGVGGLGRLHIDPRVYDEVLGDVDSPALVVSTKFTAGDFFSYLPLNPTLARGRHRRLIELQARPEFEGFSAFPDFLGEDHARAVRLLGAANPRIAGTYILTQFGGPLRAGPRALYPIHGFWLWNDANVFVASHLAVDPGADVTDLARQWAARTFGDEPRVVDAVVTALVDTRNAVLKGFYVRPFAERDVRVPGLMLPPLMWIFEWDMIGGWHSLLSLVYRGTRDSTGVAIDEGYAAVAAVRRAREQLRAAFAAAASCPSVCEQAIASLEYQEDLFALLAVWRQTFLSYYRWLDTGDSEAWRDWRTASVRFRTAAAGHRARFGRDLDFPAFDMSSAMRTVAAAEWTGWGRGIALLLLATLGTLVGLGHRLHRTGASRPGRALGKIGRLLWISAVTPWRIDHEPADFRTAASVVALTLIIVGFLAETLAGFATPGFGAGAVVLCAVVALAFAGRGSTTTGAGVRGRPGLAALCPFIPGASLALAASAYLGPLGVWYLFWTSPGFRIASITIGLATLLWAAYGMLAVSRSERWYRRIAGPLAAAGAGLVTLALLMPQGSLVLRYLDRPLNLAPATDTMVFALQTYAGVTVDITGVWFFVGLMSFAAGCVLRGRGRTVRPA